jgi:drug/metabolite transporter (DMT)-like permease
MSPNLRGILLMIVATLVFNINDAMLKLATEGVPPFEALLLRGIAASIWSVPLIVFTGTAGKLGGLFHPRVVARNLFELIAVLFFIVALTYLPIADITALVQVAPMLLLVGVAVFYREKVRPLQWVLIVAGFAGALLVAQPGGADFSMFSVFGLLCAVATAGRDIIGRRVPTTIPGPVVAVCAILLVTLGAGVVHFAFESWAVVDLRHVLLLAGSGLFLMFGHLFIFLAYRTGEVGATAPFFYMFTLWSLISGALVFHTLPNALGLAGMGLILASGVAVVLISERARRLRVLA